MANIVFIAVPAKTELMVFAHPAPTNSATLEDWMMLKWTPLTDSTVHLETPRYAQILEPL